MKKKYYVSLLIGLALLSKNNNIYANTLNISDLLGFWYIPQDTKNRIFVADFFEKDGKLYTYTYAFVYQDLLKSDIKYVSNTDESLKKNEINSLVFMYDLRFKDNKFINGKIYSPDDDKYYYLRGSVSTDYNTITWKASIDGAGLVGKTFVWKRVMSPSKYASLKPDMNAIKTNITLEYKRKRID